MPETTFSLFERPESRTLQTSLSLADRPADPLPLTERFRPKRLSDVVGQGYVTDALKDFATYPHSQAFIFSGHTGTGKTSCAFALANELGIDRDWGLRHVKSGELDQDEVLAALDQLRFICPAGSGWKMVICDEADLMSNKAAALWLSGLESIPNKSVIIFTTNNVEKFPQRFVDRCEHLIFESSPSVVGQDAQVLLNRLWIELGIPGAPPSVERIPGIIAKDGGFPALSFRRVVRYVEQELRKPRNLRAEREAKIASADSITFEPRAFREMRKVSL